MRKFLILMKLNLLIVSLAANIFGSISKKMIAKSNVKNIFPMFSFKSFIVRALTFRPLIYFDFIFANNVNYMFNFILCMWISCFHTFVKKTIFYLLNGLGMLIENQVIIYVRFYFLY